MSVRGGDDPSNLIALCPTDHSLYHRGTITRESVYCYRAMLIAIGRAFDTEAIDKLLFPTTPPSISWLCQGTGFFSWLAS